VLNGLHQLTVTIHSTFIILFILSAVTKKIKDKNKKDRCKYSASLDYIEMINSSFRQECYIICYRFHVNQNGTTHNRHHSYLGLGLLLWLQQESHANKLKIRPVIVKSGFLTLIYLFVIMLYQ